jgi:hypothetical protein
MLTGIDGISGRPVGRIVLVTAAWEIDRSFKWKEQR